MRCRLRGGGRDAIRSGSGPRVGASIRRVYAVMCAHMRIVHGSRACSVVGRRYIAMFASGRERFVCLRERRTPVVRSRYLHRSARTAELRDKLCVPAHHIVRGRARSQSRVAGARAMHACAAEGCGNRHTARRRSVLYGTQAASYDTWRRVAAAHGVYPSRTARHGRWSCVTRT